MFAAIWTAMRKSPISRPVKARPCLEVLEDRNLLSGGPGPSLTNVSGPSPAALTGSTSGQTSGGSGSGALGISGPQYPLAPSCGPTRPDPGTLSQPSGSTVLVGITGTPGGPGPTVTVVPVCTGTSTSGTTGGP
jgi:hypothetical protein